MRKLLTAIFFGLLLIVGAGTESAQSGDATFNLTNNGRFNIMVKFFSQNRTIFGRVPPGTTILTTVAGSPFASHARTAKRSATARHIRPTTRRIGALASKGTKVARVAVSLAAVMSRTAGP